MIQLGWVDFSSDDRSRVQNVLAMLKEPGALDELGIGQIRDAYSDLLFPGFSTIQTRARYFLSTPRILLDWSRRTPRQRSAKPLEAYLRDAENQMAKAMSANHQAAGLPLEGIIGHTLVEGGGVARRPSSTYWNGLRTFGIVNTTLSLAEFCREWRRDDDAYAPLDADEGNDDVDQSQKMKVLEPPDVEDRDICLPLSPDEAIFLETRLSKSAALEHTVAGQLLTAKLAKKAVAKTYEQFAVFCDWACAQTGLSETLLDNLERAQRFSLAVEGAHIIFNDRVADKWGYPALTKQCADEFVKWQKRSASKKVFHAGAADEWLDAVTTAKVRVHPRTITFLEKWNEAMCSRAPMEQLNSLVSTQAKMNKPGRSLLERRPAREAKWFGMKALEYRWATARAILADVVEGMHA